VNRLTAATSPYLQQHADNPVDWHEWGEEAFAEARRRDVPLLISVGYSACHWCHVMAHESFEDADTAALMNAEYVCVKVDREERPDVDAVYMAATQAMTGSGGWPMTVFATPDGRPFYCGTYYPKVARGGMASFAQVLSAVDAAWRDRRDEVEAVGTDVAASLASTTSAAAGISSADTGSSTGADTGTDAARTTPATPATSPTTPLVSVDLSAGFGADSSLLDAAIDRIAQDVDPGAASDPRRAGFGGAPKFPPSMTLLHLLRHNARTGSALALDLVARICAAMARGGMYDQLGGGFSRYAVDATWTVPHFEKMLYDNALLLRVYALYAKATRDPMAARITRETAEYLLGQRTPEGGFAASLDADTAGVEGLTYVWTPAQLTGVLGPQDGAWAASLFRVTPAGTFEHGASVLELLADPEPAEAERYARVRSALLAARNERPQPGRDDKVVAAWNGLAVIGLVEASNVAEDGAALLDAARDAADFLARVHLRDGRLIRTSRAGRPSDNPGVLEDYGCVAEAFTVLFSATGERRWLDLAGQLLATVRTQFESAAGFHDTAADSAALYFRPSDPTDNATPSGVSAAAAGFAAYALAAAPFDDSVLDRLDDAYRALAAALRLAERAPRFAGYGLAVAEALLADTPAAFACPGPFCAVPVPGTASGSAPATESEPGSGSEL
jgi:uncharacterized protein